MKFNLFFICNISYFSFFFIVMGCQTQADVEALIDNSRNFERGMNEIKRYDFKEISLKNHTFIQGTGLLVSNGGIVVTANHVVSGVKNCSVEWKNQILPAVTIIRDADNDIALLRTDFENKKSVRLNNKNISAGDQVWAIGYRADVHYPTQINRGRVRNTKSLSSGYIRLDMYAMIEPGMSGGAITTRDGSVVGIISGIWAHLKNTAFATPVSKVQKLAVNANIDWPNVQGSTSNVREFTVKIMCW